MVIKTVLIDDNPELLTLLHEAIDGIQDVEVIAEFKTAEEFLRTFKRLRFDLCIVDFHLQGMNGFECARKLQDKKVILTSPEAIPADEVLEIDEVVDVIKIANPINVSRLTKAIKRVRNELLNEWGYAIFKVYPKTVRQIKLEDIVYIEAEGEYKKIITESKEEIRTQPYKVGEILEKLPERHFCQINKSVIINVNYFHSFTRHDAITLRGLFRSEFSVSKPFFPIFADKIGLTKSDLRRP